MQFAGPPIFHGPVYAASHSTIEEPRQAHQVALLFVCNGRGVVHHGEPDCDTNALSELVENNENVIGFFSGQEIGPSNWSLCELSRLGQSSADITFHGFCTTALLIG